MRTSKCFHLLSIQPLTPLTNLFVAQKIMSTFHSEEENAGNLQFGKEFEDVGCLMNDEALYLIENKVGTMDE